jgi:cytochrome c-type biogenesis protein CcmE
MKPHRRQRLVLVVFILVVASAGAGLLTYALRENINLFYTPSQVVAGEAPHGVHLRVGGMVVKGSLVRSRDSLASRFELTDGAGVVTVTHDGILPDMFAEGEAAVAAGAVDSNGVLVADEVLAKHDEDYTPPEVAGAMQAAQAKKDRDMKLQNIKLQSKRALDDRAGDDQAPGQRRAE